MMMKNTYIGYVSSWGDSTIVTPEYLVKYSYLIDNYTVDQLCDWRFSTNLQRFKYDPFTGEKIDWKEVKKYLKDKLKK